MKHAQGRPAMPFRSEALKSKDKAQESGLAVTLLAQVELRHLSI
jgi:hypothetical protein